VGLWTVLFVGVIFFVSGLGIGGWYLGFSGHVTGSVVAVNAGRPTVGYSVDGQAYQIAASEHGPQFATGQQLNLCYNPGDPSQAQTCSSRTAMVVFCGAGLAGAAAAVVIGVWIAVRRGNAARVISDGTVVSADITGARNSRSMHWGKKTLWRLTCAWTEPATRRRFEFTSPSLLCTDPRPALDAAKVTALPVYVDQHDAAKRYFVDTRLAVDAMNARQRAR